MQLSLENKYAVVCGSSQGIGYASGQALAGLGATCILLARNAGRLAEMTKTLAANHGQRHQYRVADFTLPETVRTAIEEIVASTPIHILVNNTGGPKSVPIDAAAPAEFIEAFQQHLICNQILANAVLPGMKDAAYGRIINIISTSVKTPPV